MINNYDLDKRLDEVLALPMQTKFSDDFAYRISRKIEIRNLADDKKIQNISLIATVLFTVVSLLLLIAILNESFISQIQNWGTWAVLFGVLVLIFQIIENKLLRGNARFQ